MNRTYLTYSQNLKYFGINPDENMGERWLRRDEEETLAEEEYIEDGHPEDN